MEIKWRNRPDKHNYPAAISYLSLIFSEKTAKYLVGKLRQAKVVGFKSKDIFRASGLSLLGVSNSHVVENRRKIEAGEKLSPILLVRDAKIGKVIIADGYHRLCSVYQFNEDEVIPCQIVKK